MTKEEKDNISKMIRSSNYHETGLQLANTFHYPSFEILIDLIYYYSYKPTSSSFDFHVRHYLSCYLASFVFDQYIRVQIVSDRIKGVSLIITNKSEEISILVCEKEQVNSLTEENELDNIIECKLKLIEHQVKELLKCKI